MDKRVINVRFKGWFWITLSFLLYKALCFNTNLYCLQMTDPVQATSMERNKVCLHILRVLNVFMLGVYIKLIIFVE
jgi:hypothetical protein